MKRTFHILIPAFNAAETLPGLLERLHSIVGNNGILIIDDGSDDDTARVAEQNGARVVRHETNRGKGAALRTGFMVLLKEKSIASVITMDADLQHDVEDLPKFLDARSSTGAGVIVGVRRKLGTGMPIHRMLSNMVTSMMVSARTGIFIADSQCGYRLIGREVLEAICIDADGYEAETELLIRSSQQGFSIVGVPVNTVYRREQSHMTHWITMKRFVQTLLKEY